MQDIIDLFFPVVSSPYYMAVEFIMFVVACDCLVGLVRTILTIGRGKH